MIILGLDVSSSSTGWAVVKNGRFYKREDVDYGFIKGKLKVGPAEKLSSFKDRLRSLINDIEPDYIVVEDVFYGRSAKTFKVLSRYSGVTLDTCWDILNSEPIIVLPTAVRSVWGAQNKKEIFDIIVKKYELDWTFKKYNDITDAIALAIYGHKYVRGKINEK